MLTVSSNIGTRYFHWNTISLINDRNGFAGVFNFAASKIILLNVKSYQKLVVNLISYLSDLILYFPKNTHLLSQKCLESWL